jgi:DNA-binding response OmpR family regulator
MHLIYVLPGQPSRLVPIDQRARIDALESLGHSVQVWHQSPDTLLGRTVDAIVVDGALDVAPAGDYCRDLSLLGVAAPVLVILRSRSASEVSPSWDVDDFALETSTPIEILVRISRMTKAATLRRTDGHRHQCGPLTLDDYRLTLSTSKHGAVALTRTEHAVLSVFFTKPDVVISRDLLLSRAWDGRDVASTRTIDTFISRIRRKFGSLGIEITTVRGVGYRLTTREAAQPKATPSGTRAA